MKAVVLLSGGVDSATCLGLAVSLYGAENVAALSIVYGQKHVKEFECAQKLARHYNVALYTCNLESVYKYSDCSLLKNSTKDIIHKSYSEQIAEKGKGTVDTYVPFRNGLMLSSAGALALSIFPKEKVVLMYGAHADDAAGAAYPDCSWAFVDTMKRSLLIGSGKLLFLEAPFVLKNKAEVVKTGLKLGVPYELTWSCYEGKDKACGTCGTCIDRLNAFKENGVEDPIKYENNGN